MKNCILLFHFESPGMYIGNMNAGNHHQITIHSLQSVPPMPSCFHLLGYFPRNTVDVPLTDHIWQIRWYFSYLFEFNIWHLIFQKIFLYSIYKLYYFCKFDFLEQYLRERFNTTSGFHFETKSSISGSSAFICLHD